MRKIISTLILVFSFSVIYAQKQAPVNVIFDTDIGPDYDDVGAMAILHTLADSGQVNILATVACNQSKYIAGVLSVLNTYFKRPTIPIGVVRGKAVNKSAWQKWDSALVAKYPHQIQSNEQAQDALTLYRRILAKQADKSVVIISVGFFSNLADLILSKPDKYSPLSGAELVKKKVKKLVSMAGRFPKGSEYNVECDIVSSRIVAEKWNTEIIFSGFEIGFSVHTGLPLVQNAKIQNSPIKDAFAMSIPLSKEDESGRMSWDQTAVLVGIKGYEPYYSLVEGRFVCTEYGENAWDAKGKGHFYLMEKMPVPQIELILNQLMMR